MTHRLTPAHLALLFGLGCGEGAADDTSAAAPLLADFLPTLPAGGCDLPAYDWLPTGDMGEILDWEWLPELSMTPEEAAVTRVAAGLTGLEGLEYGTRVYRIRYRTQDRGQAVEATAFLAFPADDSRAVPEVPTGLWVHPTMGLTDACGPTGLGILGAAYPMLMASAGFAVAAPDYIGMNGWGEPSNRLHPYVVPEPTAIASLDAVRALWRFADEGLDPAVTLPLQRGVIWGASEGGFAGLWADRYTDGYLPEFERDGVSAAVVPIDVQSMLQSAATTFSETTGGVAVALVAMHDWFGQTADLEEVFVNDGDLPFLDSLVEMLNTACAPDELYGQISTVEEVFQPAFIEAASAGDFEAIEPWSCYTDRATLTTSELPLNSDTPVLVIQGENDGLVQPALHHDDVLTLCEAGYRIEYMECAGADHVGAALDTLGTQIAWIQARAAQEPWNEENLCVVTDPVDCEE